MTMSKRSLIALMFCFTLSPLTLADDKSELAALREEVKALRAEVTALRKERDELRAKLKNSKTEEHSNPEGALNGIQWEISAINKEGVALGSTTFYAQDGKVMKDGKEIGTYVDAGRNARMDITKTGTPKFNGSYKLLRIKNNPPTYSGTFKNQQGQEIRVLLKALID